MIFLQLLQTPPDESMYINEPLKKNTTTKKQQEKKETPEIEQARETRSRSRFVIRVTRDRLTDVERHTVKVETQSVSTPSREESR